MHTVPLFLALALAAQEPKPFIDVVRLRGVSVVVRDKDGKPVPDLGLKDFVVFDAGVEQRVGFVARETEEQAAAEMPASVEDVISNHAVIYKENGQVKAQALPNSLTVILLDGMNTRYADQSRAKAALIKFLKQLHSGDQVAIYTLNDGLRVLHSFTSDIGALLTVLENSVGANSAAYESSRFADANTAKAELNALIDRGNAAVARQSMKLRAQQTFTALAAIAQNMSGLQGRKNLVWVSGEFPVGPNVSRIFDAAGMSVYPVDASGLMSMAEWAPSMDASTASHSSLTTNGRPAMDARSEDAANASHASMLQLAARTGGTACVNGNDIAHCISRALDDVRATYTVYYRDNEIWDGKFHEIKIKVNRPGLEIRYRPGYFAPSDDKFEDPAPTMNEAGLSPLVSTSLTLAAKRISNGALSLVIDGHDLTFNRTSAGAHEANVDLRMLAFGEAPAPLNATGRSLHLVLTQQQYDVMLQGGVRVTLNVEAPEHAERLRIVARDAASGRVGSLDVPLR